MELLRRENINILKFHEDLTLENIEEFKWQTMELISSDAENLILSLEGVAYLNSTALGIIANSVIEGRKNHKELVISDADENVQEIFNMVKFKTFIKIYETLEEAVQSFKN